jgi:hypothetical protein
MVMARKFTNEIELGGKLRKKEKKCEYSFFLNIMVETLAVFRRRPDYEQQNKQTDNITFAAGMRCGSTGKD